MLSALYEVSASEPFFGNGRVLCFCGKLFEEKIFSFVHSLRRPIHSKAFDSFSRICYTEYNNAINFCNILKEGYFYEENK